MIKDLITSVKNQKITNFQHLQKAKERKEQDIFIIEGIKEIEKAVKSNYVFRTVFFCAKIISFETVKQILKQTIVDEIFEVNLEVYQKIAYRENTEGIVVLAKPKNHFINNLDLKPNALVLILEGLEKPGNIGAILRTADAAGVDAVIMCELKTDLYNPNLIRASLGCLFSLPIAICDSENTIEWLQQNNIKIYCTNLEASIPYYSVDFRKSSAIVMGTESTGITNKWIEAADKNIIIPMNGEADSMNVSTSAAVIIFEAFRQRKSL